MRTERPIGQHSTLGTKCSVSREEARVYFKETYSLSISKKEVSFNVYRRSSEFPAYKITKNLKPKNQNEKYIIKNSQNKIIENSESLENLIKKIIWKKFKLVN